MKQLNYDINPIYPSNLSIHGFVDGSELRKVNHIYLQRLDDANIRVDFILKKYIYTDIT